MTYTTLDKKWNAFKYKDPFSANKFLVGNTETLVLCRPNCDILTSADIDHSKVRFFNNFKEAACQDYTRCHHCLPDFTSKSTESCYIDKLNQQNYVVIDLNLLYSTVKTVNKQIGFMPPMINNDERSFKNAIFRIKNSKLRNKISQYTYSDFLDLLSTNEKKVSNSKSDLVNLRLMDLACRHIALAAQSTIYGVQFAYDKENNILENSQLDKELECEGFELSYDESNIECASDEENETGLGDEATFAEEESISLKYGCFLAKNKKLSTKKRRGGVLGFKDLAAKSQLSPWHFHRTFKSITGLTPKQYGDRCFKYLFSQKPKFNFSYCLFHSRSAIIIDAKIANPSFVSDNERTYKKANCNTKYTRQESASTEKDSHAVPANIIQQLEINKSLHDDKFAICTSSPPYNLTTDRDSIFTLNSLTETLSSPIENSELHSTKEIGQCKYDASTTFQQEASQLSNYPLHQHQYHERNEPPVARPALNTDNLAFNTYPPYDPHYHSMQYQHQTQNQLKFLSNPNASFNGYVEDHMNYSNHSSNESSYEELTTLNEVDFSYQNTTAATSVVNQIEAQPAATYTTESSVPYYRNPQPLQYLSAYQRTGIQNSYQPHHTSNLNMYYNLSELERFRSSPMGNNEGFVNRQRIYDSIPKVTPNAAPTISEFKFEIKNESSRQFLLKQLQLQNSLDKKYYYKQNISGSNSIIHNYEPEDYEDQTDIDPFIQFNV